MANELPLTDKWIYSRLHGDTLAAAIVSTRIYAERAPEGAAYPFIVYQFLAGADSKGLGTVRLLANPNYKIEVWADGAPDANVRTVADRIDALFQTAVNSISDGYVFSSRRTQPLKITESKPNSSEFWTRLGGLFRIHSHPVA